MQSPDSEIRMDDGALHENFSEQSRSRDVSGAIKSCTWGSYQNFMGYKMPYLPFIPRMDRTSHQFSQQNTKQSNNPASQQNPPTLSLAGYTECEIACVPRISSLCFLFSISHPLVLPNCLQGGSGREFDHGLYPPPIKKAIPEIDPKSDEIKVAFSVRHFP